MAPLRMLIQANGNEALRFSSGTLKVRGRAFKVERLFKNRPQAMGLSGTEWFVATAEPMDENPWESSHKAVSEGFGLGLAPGFSYAEPDIEHVWPSPHTTEARMGAAAAEPPCQPRSNDKFWPPAPNLTWFLDDEFSGLRSARNAVDHRNVRIGHIDTGYSEHATKPRNLNTALQWNFVEGIEDTHDPGIEGFLNQPGHGTGTLGILAGNVLQGLTQGNHNTGEPLGGAPDAEIVPVRVANSVLHFFTSVLAQAFDYVIAPRGDASKRCDVVSLSMGGVASKVWAEAVNRAYEAGVCIVAASGNNLTGGVVASVVYPARFHRVIAACGITADNTPYYRFGKFREMQGNFGPASKMKTAIAACTPNMPWAHRGCPQLILEDGAGTSSATPQVAAAAALWLARHNPKYDQPWKRVEAVRHALFSTGDKHFDDSARFYGNGAVRARAALDVLPLKTLEKAPEDRVFLPTLRVITGLGIAPAQMEMFHVEASQLVMTCEALNGIFEDPDAAVDSVRDDTKIKHFMEALIAEKKCSAPLRRYMESEYLLRYKTLPAGTSQPSAQPAFPAGKQQVSAPAFRALRGYAFDPSLSASLATAAINEMTFQVRWEDSLDPGPSGEYIKVIDFDSSTHTTQPPVDLNHRHVLARAGLDPSEGNPKFHQQMVYAVGMTTIQHFERALGRPVLWAAAETPSGEPVFVPQLKVYPHAMEDRNAYYSPVQRALLFGYFPATDADPSNQFPGGITYTCLSHDIVAHETTHAILDGMHRRFGIPTNPDMLAFHEAFADIVSLFQHFNFSEALEHELAKSGDLATTDLLTGLAHQFGVATGLRGALRKAVGQKADPADYQNTVEPHARGALLVATVFDAFLAIYNLRTADLMRIASDGTGLVRPGRLPSDLVRRLSAEAATAARQVLDICIRALDYCPPVDLTFGDYLRALVTADTDLVPNDPAGYRLAFLDAFRRRGLYPRDVCSLSVESLRWQTVDEFGDPAGARKVVQVLRQYGEKCAYIQSRKRLFEVTNETRNKLGKMILKMLADSKNSQQTAQSFGLDAGNVDKIRVNTLRMAQRFRRDGQMVAQAIVGLSQEHLLPRDPDNKDSGMFEFMSGSTLVINLKEPRLDYVIVKNANAPQRIQRIREFLGKHGAIGLSAYASQEPFALLHREPEPERKA